MSTDRKNYEAMERALAALQDLDTLKERDARRFLRIMIDRFAADNSCLAQYDFKRWRSIVTPGNSMMADGTIDPVSRVAPLTSEMVDRLRSAAPGILEIRGEELHSRRTSYGVGTSNRHIGALKVIYLVPVRVKGEIWGSLSLAFNDEGVTLGEKDVGSFHRLAEVLGSGIERLLNYRELEEKRDELQRLLEVAQVAERTKSTFLATMSHEIRTPLNAIIGFAEFLQRNDLPEKERLLYVNGITRSSNALLALINDILDLSKLEAGRAEMMGGRCNLRRLFDDVASIFSQNVAEKGIALEGKIGEDVPAGIGIFEERVRQILLNLIGNAVKFTSSGFVRYSASWRKTNTMSGELTIVVEDSGIGIPKTKWDEIFNPFSQDGSVRGGKVYQGTGLGLPICRKMVEAAGGTITVSSVVNQGSKFTVVIPDVNVVLIDPMEDEGDGKAAETAAKLADVPVHVIVVDDVPMNLMIMAKYIEMLGIEKSSIESFLSAHDALEHLNSIPVGRFRTIVFTDMWMPKMNGEEFVRAIRGDDRFRDVPVIAVTADSDSSETYDMSLFNSVLTKPVTNLKLKPIIEEFVNG